MPPVRDEVQVSAVESVTFRCEFAAGRAACRLLAEFLARVGVPEEECFACELVLVEACNNAVQHAGAQGRKLPVTVTAACDGNRMEFTVIDHTDGFDWPTGPLIVPSVDAEHGRGLFIIRSMMDGASYTRGFGENTLTMWKARRESRPPFQPLHPLVPELP